MEIVRQKNVATIIVFPLVDADGDLVTGATSPDSEIDAWADGAAPDGFADCTNEATEIGSTGNYYLSLTQAEMNNDYIIVQVKSGTAKTQVILIRTMVGDPLNLAVTDDGSAINVASGIVEAQIKSIDNNAITANSIASDAITAAKIATGAIDADAIADNAIDAGAIASDAITAAKIADGAIDANTFATGAITAAAIAADAIGASELAADAVAEIQSGLSTLTQANIRSAVGLASANLDTQLSTIDDFLDTEIAAIKAKTDNLPSDPADASDIASSFSTVNTKLDTIDDFLDTEIGAIKAKTDNLPSDPADASDIASSFSAVNGKLDTIDDFLDTEVAAIKAKTDNLPSDPADESSIQAAIAGLNNLSAAQVLTQVNSALDAASTELSAVPATTGSIRQFIQFLHAYFRNKKTQTSTTETLYKEDASTTLGTSTLSDNGTTASKGEMN